MFFLNLSLPEFLAILGSISGITVALYLLDRMRKKHTVATLRFFEMTQRPPVLKHRRKLQQPLSLLLQLLSMLLLLLAIAQLRFGSPARSSRDHVLILDTSAWMNARSGQARLIDQSRAAARNYVKLLPASDRVMVLRADVLATPATVFESDRLKIQEAIDQTQPGAGPLNIQQALDFAQQAQKLQGQRPGEIVLIGAGRVSAEEASLATTPANLRVISIPGPNEHVGLRKVSVHRSAVSPDGWEVFIAVKNYGAAPHSAPLSVQFGGSPIGSQRFDLKPGAEQEASFRFNTRAAGWLEARLLTKDPFTEDTRAILELPARRQVPVTVYSAEPDLLKPVFNAIPGVQATLHPPSSYDPNTRSGVVLLDRFAPPSPPQTDAIWIEPPAAKSPVPIATTANTVKLSRWRVDHPLGTGLRAGDIQLANAELFRTSSSDIAIAESDAGALIVARDAKPKTVVLGFHPVRAGMKYELATPLLFANIVRWMAPDVFRSWQLTAGTVGTVDADLENEADPSTIHVQTEDGKVLPFSVDGRTVRFFAGAPGIVRVLTGDRELVYSLTLPQPGDVVWKPDNARRGMPGRAPYEPAARDIWQWLALLAAAGLIADWILFGRLRKGWLSATQIMPRLPWRKAS
ncbi:MAG TPA: VWA domain-containing protein [Bryobacteraceae bacterium]|nr:VWA domain-containing protein [Bryobacteraceae bacterium]